MRAQKFRGCLELFSNKLRNGKCTCTVGVDEGTNRTLAGLESAGRRNYSVGQTFVDLRSDTVTMPSKGMLDAGMQAPLGDDVFGEDPSVLELEAYMADLFGKEKGLFVPTGTMANLVAILSHCHTRASEMIIGQGSHLCLWEGGHAANLGGIHTIQLAEDDDAKMSMENVRDSFRDDSDDHWPETKLLCLENTHNMCGGVALPQSYMDEMGDLAKELNIKCHVDGARIFNSIVEQGISPSELCKSMDSVSICFSKGLGAPIGSVLVGETEFIRLAKRARKRCGGGMRQAGVVASMGLYAVKNNVDRLKEDHVRAKKIGKELKLHGMQILRDGKIDTNIVYFALPEDSRVTKEELAQLSSEKYGVKFGGGYSKGGKLFRLVTHMGVDDEGVDRAIEAIVNLTTRGS
jgi:threonine aldolase